eukprot:COSAG06_NODE_73581_length_155_cov_218.946429_1_plen_41_part_01
MAATLRFNGGGKNGLHPRSRVHPVFHISKVKIFKGEPRRTR